MTQVTLLITTHNRDKLLLNSLERLCELTKPDELLVIDDGGIDFTAEICSRYEDRLPVRYVYHDNPGPSICSFARNVGIKLASYDMIITTEPEIVFITDVIPELLATKADNPTDVISAGRIHHASVGVGWQSARHQKPTGLGWVAPYVALYEREWLEAIGGWDESFPGDWGWDDTDLLTRLRLTGHNQKIDNDIQIVHQWHELGGDPGNVNEAHFTSKSFHDHTDMTDVVANKGKSWGTLITRDS